MANSVANFIPEVWSLNMQSILDIECVWSTLVNREHEGEIKEAGDTVHVRTFGDVTINNYTRNAAVTYQDLQDPMSDMVIDQQKSFAFKVDDLDKAQSDIKILEGYTKRAAQAIKEVVDQHLHSHYTDVPAANVIGTSGAPINITADNVYSYATQLGEILRRSNVPMEGRNLIVCPSVETAFLNSPQFLRSTALGDKTVTEGRIGRIGTFEVHVSNNMNTVNGNTPVMACTKDFISYAGQVAKVESLRLETYFANAVRGLYLYGSKVFTNTASGKGPDKASACLWVAGN